MSRARPFQFRHQPMTRWSPAAALRRTACRVEDAKAALFDIISIWGDVDQGLVDDAEGRIADLDEWLAEIRETIKQRQAAGEDIGL